MNSIKEKRKVSNYNATKENQLKKVWTIEEKKAFVIEGNKQRVNITINSGLWNEFKNIHNKSRLMEELLRKFLEKEKGKEVILRKSIL